MRVGSVMMWVRQRDCQGGCLRLCLLSLDLIQLLTYVINLILYRNYGLNYELIHLLSILIIYLKSLLKELNDQILEELQIRYQNYFEVFLTK